MSMCPLSSLSIELTEFVLSLWNDEFKRSVDRFMKNIRETFLKVCVKNSLNSLLCYDDWKSVCVCVCLCVCVVRLAITNWSATGHKKNPDKIFKTSNCYKKVSEISTSKQIIIFWVQTSIRKRPSWGFLLLFAGHQLPGDSGYKEK